MKLSKAATSVLLAVLISPSFKAHAEDVRLAADPARRAIAVSVNEAPLLIAPKTTTISEGVLTSIEATGMDTDPEDSLAFSVSGLPPGMKAIVGIGGNGKKVASAFGIAESAEPFTVTWVVTDGSHAPVSSQTTVSVSPSDNSRIVERVTTLVHGRYPHGISRPDARGLGIAALPVLAQMLRDEREKSCWPNIAVAIGAIGDTAYFDTLRSFVWTRFGGEVDHDTFLACEIAQANVGTMANLSPRVAAYILASTNPATWASLPWYTQRYQGERLRVQMSQFAITALSHFNDASATAKLTQLEASPYSPGQVYAVRDALKTNAVIRRVGLIEYQKQIESGGQ